MSELTSISDKWKSVLSQALEVYSVKALADLLEVDRNTITRWQRFGVLPDVVSLSVYCKRLGVDITALVADTCNQDDERLFQRRDVTSEALALPIEDRKKLLVEVAKSL